VPSLVIVVVPVYEVLVSVSSLIDAVVLVY